MGSDLYLTVDIDWAPEHVLEDYLSLVRGLNLPTTYFCTHKSESTDKLISLTGGESALHPNLLGAKDESAKFNEYVSLFPKSKGVRTHRLYFHSGLMPIYHKAGIQYLSHDIFFLREKIVPFYDWSGLVRLPIYWEDDVHCHYFNNSFDVETLGLKKEGIKIFNFHPVHIYLNTRRFEDYSAAKPELRDAKKAVKHQKRGKGIRTLFEDLLKNIRSNETSTLLNLQNHFRVAEKYAGNYEK